MVKRDKPYQKSIVILRFEEPVQRYRFNSVEDRVFAAVETHAKF